MQNCLINIIIILHLFIIFIINNSFYSRGCIIYMVVKWLW